MLMDWRDIDENKLKHVSRVNKNNTNEVVLGLIFIGKISTIR